MRIERNVARQAPFTIRVDGEDVTAYPGEMLATALIGHSVEVGRDTSGGPRGVFCNMGTCGQCTVTLLPEGRRVRACIVPAQPGMEVARD